MERLVHDGVSICFEDTGKGAPPVLLIHDLGSDRTSLQPQLERFRGQHRVVAVDLLGHGQSDNLPAVYTIAGFAGDLAWLCYELGLYRPVAVCRGIGGIIAIQLATLYPDLLAAVVVLQSPGSLPFETPAGPYLAATWQKAMTWDGAEAPTACQCFSAIPLLYVGAGTPGADLDKLRDLCPAILVLSSEPTP